MVQPLVSEVRDRGEWSVLAAAVRAAVSGA
jgi:hypothetical protein